MADTRKVAESGDMIAYIVEILNSHLIIAAYPINSE
jgi:hypothetical protein